MTSPQLAAEKPGKEEFVDELKPGTRLLQGQYTISRFINSGGFGITYLAKDSLERNVVIKECFPGNFCRRSDTIVGARSRAHQAEFKSIVKLFVQEARSLAKLVHPNIVGVHQVFEDNDTAYMAIDFIDGRDLLDLIEDPAVQIDPARIVSMTHKLLNAVAFIHDNGILHRDISPDNILVDQKGDPILIDFGAAREEATRASRALSALRVVKDGYSPQEFYIAGSEQGPWSDLYALGATLYHAISGHPPANSQVRLASIAEGGVDPYVPLAGHFTDYPAGFLEAIDKAMNAVPRRRLQSAGDWLEMLANPPAPTPSIDPVQAVSRLISEQITGDEAVALAEPPMPTDSVRREPPMMQVAEASAVEQPVASAAAHAPVHPTRVSPAYERIEVPAKGGSGRGLLIGVSVVAVLAVAGYVALQMGEQPKPSPVVETPAAAVSEGIEPATEDALGQAGTATVVTQAEPAADDSAASANSAGSEAVAAAEAPADAAAEPVAEEPAAAPVPEADTAENEVTPPAQDETAAMQAEVVNPEPGTLAEPAIAAASEPAAAETAASAEQPAEEPVVATEATEAAATPVAAPVPAPVPAAIQIAYALWDVKVPFQTAIRSVGGVNYASITEVNANADLAVAGEWIKPGATVYSVNGNAVSPQLDVGALILRNLSVERDGMARTAVRIKAPGQSQYERVQLVVPVVRRVGLVSGLTAEARVADGAWQITVVTAPKIGTTLLPGDALLSETTTGVKIARGESLEDILSRLVERKTATAQFEVLRGGATATASLDLATE